jgi:hypothetical protein
MTVASLTAFPSSLSSTRPLISESWAFTSNGSRRRRMKDHEALEGKIRAIQFVVELKLRLFLLN